MHYPNLRLTFEYRIRYAGWSNEDFKELPGHKNDGVTAHYSRVEIDRFQEVVESISKPYGHKMATLKVVGVWVRQLSHWKNGGYALTRTGDPIIMRRHNILSQYAPSCTKGVAIYCA